MSASRPDKAKKSAKDKGTSTSPPPPRPALSRAADAEVHPVTGRTAPLPTTSGRGFKPAKGGPTTADALMGSAGDKLVDLGVRVPDDLSVVGSDDIPFAALSDPGLSSIATPMDRAGTLACEILRRATAERAAPRVVRLPTHLVVRGTTGPAPVRAGDGALEVTP